MPKKGDQIAGSDTQVAAFLFGLARGETVVAAAKAAGLVVTTLYGRRKRDPLLAACWREAAALAREADLAARRAAHAEAEEDLGTVVRRHAGRRLVRKRKRPVEFDRDRKQVFLDHVAASCDLEEAALAAGISMSAFYRALKADPAFRTGFEEALQLGYLCLEAEALRQQREAQREYRLNPGDAEAKAKSFERTMHLLREYKRAAGGTVSMRADRSRARWTFEASIEAIEKGLKAFGVEIPGLPPPESGEEAQGPLHPPADGPCAGRPVPRTGLNRAGHGSPAHPRPGEDQEDV